MGNNIFKMASQKCNLYSSVSDFKSLKFMPLDATNGLCFNNYFIPDDVVINILSYVEPDKLLQLGLVCKRWCHLVKSNLLWMSIYERKYRRRAKRLPWFVYYCLFNTDLFSNLLKNGNGQNGMLGWNIVKNYGDQFKIEGVPLGSDPLPAGVPDFNGHSSCFVTSYYECNKWQSIRFDIKGLFLLILQYYKPNIVASEWVTGRFDCGCIYTLRVKLLSRNSTTLKEYVVKHRIEQWEGRTWEKMEIVVAECQEEIAELIFEHEGQDTQFWKGHYGSKMAGGVVKVDFDSIQPKENDIFFEMF